MKNLFKHFMLGVILYSALGERVKGQDCRTQFFDTMTCISNNFDPRSDDQFHMRQSIITTYQSTEIDTTFLELLMSYDKHYSMSTASDSYRTAQETVNVVHDSRMIYIGESNLKRLSDEQIASKMNNTNIYLENMTVARCATLNRADEEILTITFMNSKFEAAQSVDSVVYFVNLTAMELLSIETYYAENQSLISLKVLFDFVSIGAESALLLREPSEIIASENRYHGYAVRSLFDEPKYRNK